ncbi:MAG TPA: zinc-ribbon domain-containing protein [Polyangiaceae bacterium]|nr:zinc-ribbon domain-containing protein [Polyangiaceae bacterium]
MKVPCGQCSAKYQVSDERVQDRKVRIHCKRCGAAIVVDGKVSPPLVTSTPARPSVRPPANAAPMVESQAPPDLDSDRPSPRPVAHTIMGGLEAPAAERLEQQRLAPLPPGARSPASPYEAAEDRPPPAGMPAEHRGFTNPPVGAVENRWRVALTKQDLRWMTTDEIIEAYRSGAVKLETFVFRAGMPTWVTLPEVPEIAAALTAAGIESGASVSSLPPPKSPSSRPPPRKIPARSSAAEASALAALADLDAEPLPFALVSQRSNGLAAGAQPGYAGEAPPPPARSEVEPAAFEPPAPPEAPERPSFERLSVERLSAVESLSMIPDEPVVAPMPFAAATQQASSGSSKWMWVAVVVLLLAAAGAFVAPRLGVKLF